MTSLHIRIGSPLPIYLDQQKSGSSLAQRPRSLEDKVVGLLPNWRPSAVHILEAVGALIEECCKPRAIVMEQMLREVPIRTGRLIDGMRQQLDQFAEQVDVAIIATGD